jgi:hypothetical protein
MGLVVGTPTTRIDALEKALGNYTVGRYWQRWLPWMRKPLKRLCVAFVWSMIPFLP